MAGILPIPAQSPIDTEIQDGTDAAETHYSKNRTRKVGFRCSASTGEFQKNDNFPRTWNHRAKRPLEPTPTETMVHYWASVYTVG